MTASNKSRFLLKLAGLSLMVMLSAGQSHFVLAQAQPTGKAVPKDEQKRTLEKATFAGGCFWHMEDDFRKVKGVKNVVCGYTGGNYKDPTYKDVCSGKTHHAEAVEVEFDPSKVSYNQLLATFWRIHDPTTPNQQGPDIGEQYRSVIFYHNAEQKKQAMASEKAVAVSGAFRQPIVTQILPAGPFYRAEDYHQHYYEKHPGIGSCRF